jgi:transcriptional regulator with XRE-family HTH domain
VIRSTREKLELSQEELAEASGLHPTYVGMIERAQRNVTVLKLAQIAKALRVTGSSLLAEAEKSRR